MKKITRETLWEATLHVSVQGKQPKDLQCTFVLQNLLPRILAFINLGDNVMILLSGDLSDSGGNITVPKAVADEIMRYMSLASSE